MKIMIIFECKVSTKTLNAALKEHSCHLFLILQTILKETLHKGNLRMKAAT